MHKTVYCSLFLLLSCFFAQAQSSVPDAATTKDANSGTKVPSTIEFADDAGFTFTYPSSWQVIDSRPLMPVAQAQAQEKSTGEAEKKGIACSRLPLLLRNEQLQSSIVTITLAYDCVGGVLKQSSLAATAVGISAGIKKNFVITDAVYGDYKLGQHELWIERAKAAPIVAPGKNLDLEIVCTMLKKAMVCWAGFAGTPSGLNALEAGKVSLEGDKPLALVPPSATKNLK
jgi:hypothetical protein